MSGTDTNTVKVSILGEEYTLRGFTETERITETASYVDEKLRHARARSGQPQDLTKIAILTSLNIAFELFQARDNAGTELDDVRGRASELVDRLERCLVDNEVEVLSESARVAGDTVPGGSG